MAKVKIADVFLSERLFGVSKSQVTIKDGRFDRDRCILELEIEGADVPDASEVYAQFTVAQNRAGEKFHTLEFVPVKK